ncbi:MAG TPA: transcriptional regulator, partial [Blastocatellia bacterium]|nr:transcriptional regulator [Blastocatellia bacterium]
MTRHSQSYYEFGPFRLYPDERRLCRDHEVVSLPPKVCELLLVMVQHPGQILDREELMKAVWPDTVVEEANLNVHVSALRKALCETSSERYIETLPRRGYRFLAHVKETIDENYDLAMQAETSQPGSVAS